MSITAEFEQTPRYTVTFLDWDDEVLKQEKVKEGEDATAPEDPYREGYTFMGWKPADFTDIHSNLTVHAQYEKEEYVFECGDHLLGVLTDHVLTITGYGDMWDWEFNGTPWFNVKNDITSVQLPDGLTSIGNYAFDGCESLTSIDIPAGVTNIGFAAFSKCYSLTSIDIPAGVTDIKTQTFYNCYNLTSVNLPAGVTDIGNAAFYGCNSLTSINIPEGVTGIGNLAFNSCGLTSIDIPASVTGIGDNAFSYCLSLNSVTCHAAEPPVLGDDVFGNIDRENIPLYVPKASIDKYKAAEQWKDFRIETASNMCGDHLFWEIKDGVLTITGYGDMWNWDDIKNYAPWFDYQEEITSVQLPDGLTSIGDYAFYSCISLESITIPAGVTSIGTCAFIVCNALESITIPAGVTSIGENAFYYCYALTSISVSEENEHYCDIDGVLFNKSKTILLQYPSGRTEESYTVPDGVTEIGVAAFFGSGVKNIHLPEGVTVIGVSAFDHSILETIYLPESLTGIGEGAFYYCGELKAIDIPAGVTNIGESAFSFCSDLTSVTCRAVEPPVLGDEAFSEYACENVPLFVPKASLDKYKAAELWKEFAQIDSYDATVTFLDKDGNLIEEQYVVKGEGAVAPDAPAVEGYEFKGWDTDFTNVQSDLTVRAIYEKKPVEIKEYTVIFLGFNDVLIASVKVKEGEAAQAPVPQEVEGYTFIGWDKDFSNISSDLTVTALYKKNTYTVTFLGFDGETVLKSETVEYGESATAPEAPAVEHYTFTGWDTNDYTFVSKDLTVNAVYEIDKFNVIFVGFGGVTLKEEVVPYGGSATAPSVPFVEGYDFKGWDTDFTNVQSDLIVTALYESNVVYHTLSLAVEGNGKIYFGVYNAFGELQEVEATEKSYTLEEGSQFLVIAHADEGWQFSQWADGETKQQRAVTLTSDISLKAIFTQIPVVKEYTVTFLGFNDAFLASEKVKEGEAAQAPEAPAVEGYDFKGWDTDFTNVQSDLTVRAIYEKKPVEIKEYTVIFLGFNDIELKVENVEYGGSATAPDAPDVEGYTFTGWDKAFDNVTSDLIVTAQYDINYYALTLVAEHGTIEITDESGEHSLNPDMVMHGTIVKLIVTADDGYLFKGWSDSNTDNPRFVTVTEDKTFTALFEKEPDDPTGVEEVESQKSKVESTKLLRDGMLYILREGKMYNTQGQKVQ